MNILNLYYNPRHLATTTSEDCPLYYIGENMSVVFVNDDIVVKTLGQGGSHIVFGGHGGRFFRLGFVCGETYTASLKVCINNILRGDLLPDALRLKFYYIDETGQKKQIISEAAPNEIGIWEVHLTFTVPPKAEGAWLLFVCGTQIPSDIVTISDVRITKTDGRIAPFDRANNNIKTPYCDTIDETVCVREYADKINMRISDYIDYLQYAMEYYYSFDLKIVREIAENSTVYKLITELFVNSEICEYTELKTMLAECDDDAKVKIVEKMMLLKKFALVENLLQENLLPENDFAIKLCQVNLKTNKKENIEAAKLLKNILNSERNCIYNLSCEELYEILMPISQNTAIQRYNTTKWVMKNLPEIQRRAKLLSKSEPVKTDESPVWVYWAQGIENAPEIVKMCVAKMKKVFGQRLCVLSDKNLHYFISTYYIEKIPTFASKSDYIRTELLYRYGGTWIDSTVLVKDEFKDIIDGNTSVFIGWYPDSRSALSSWMMSIKEKTGYLYSLIYSALIMYISTFGAFNEYFMFHCIFRILVTVDKSAKEMWDKAYKISVRNSIKITNPKGGLFNVIDDNKFERIYNDSPLLKLTYKYDDQQVKINHNISKIIRRNL